VRISAEGWKRIRKGTFVFAFCSGFWALAVGKTEGLYDTRFVDLRPGLFWLGLFYALFEGKQCKMAKNLREIGFDKVKC